MKFPDKFIMADAFGNHEWTFEKVGDTYSCVCTKSPYGPASGCEYGPYTESGIENLMQVTGHYIKEDLSYDDLPDYFEFKTSVPEFTWYMRKEADGVYKCGEVGQSLGAGEVDYKENASYVKSLQFVRDNFKRGDWVMVMNTAKIEANGVNGYGDPLNFTEDDLELLQRVELANGEVGIVVKGMFGEGLGVAFKDATWDDIIIESEAFYEDDYVIVKVYDCPEYPNEALNPESKGELLWQRKDQVVDQAIQQRLDYFKTHIEAVRENLESLQREYDELKAFV